MKRLAAILFSAFCILHSAFAEYPVATNASIVRFASSYLTLNTYGPYADSGKYMRWWTNKIHCFEENRSGAGMSEANQNRLERRGLAAWVNGDQWWGIMHVDNNGGVTTALGVYADLTNTLNAPGLFYNGTAYTNESGWAAAHAGQIKWLSYGDIPQPGHLVGSDAEVRNNAMTNAPALYGNYGALDVFHPIYTTYGRSNDIQTGADYWQKSLSATLANNTDGEHPGPPGGLLLAVNEDSQWMDTNANSCSIDYGAATLNSSAHCTVSGITRSWNTLSFTWKADWHTMGFDYPDGTITNDALTGAAAMCPAITNAFHEDLIFTGLADGTYTLTEDGSNIWSQAVSGGTLTVNLFALPKGAVWAQRKEVVGRVRDRIYCDRVTLLFGSAGDGHGEPSYDSHTQDRWDAGLRGDALVASSLVVSSIADFNTRDQLIYSAATPTNHAFALVGPPIPRYAPFHR